MEVQDYKIQLAGIEEESIVDGPGLRLVIFTQGCPHHCRGCHNPKTHPLEGGTPTKLSEIIAKYRQNPLLDGMTFSGGEPFLHARLLALLGKNIRNLGGTIVTYTGYTYEELKHGIEYEKKSDWQLLLDETDILIDGPYIEAQRDLSLLFRGSVNQRILDRAERATILTARTSFIKYGTKNASKEKIDNRPAKSNQGKMP